MPSILHAHLQSLQPSEEVRALLSTTCKQGEENKALAQDHRTHICLELR